SSGASSGAAAETDPPEPPFPQDAERAAHYVPRFLSLREVSMKKTKQLILALCVAALAACGGGGGGSTSPKLTVLFPPAASLTENAESIMVRGSSKHVVAVTVNGAFADVSANGDWQIRAPLAEGDNTIEIIAENDKGETTTTEVEVRNVSFIPDDFQSLA